MKNSPLASESFSRGRTRYFIDVREASNHSNYFTFTKTCLLPDQSYERNTFFLWNEDIQNFIAGLSSLLHSMAYLNQQDVTLHQLREQNKQKPASGIKALEPSMRPREKLVLNGSGALSDAELLALLIGSGSADESAVALGARIMALADFDPAKLDSLDFARLCALKGMGLAKSSAVLSAIELSRRMARGGSQPLWVYTRTDGH